MAKRKTSTPRKSGTSIVRHTDKCAGCHEAITGSLWSDVIVDHKGRWMHRRCTDIVIKSDMDELEAILSKDIKLSIAAAKLARDKHVEYVIKLEIDRPGMDVEREKWCAHLTPGLRQIYLAYRHDQRWKDFVNGIYRLDVSGAVCDG